jgi:hypothetical protein
VYEKKILIQTDLSLCRFGIIELYVCNVKLFYAFYKFHEISE